jgi:quercetin dioxygenase-like cupin family protein
MPEPVHIPAAAPRLQTWDDPRHGRVGFRLLVDSREGPSQGLVQGLIEFGAGDREKPHRHPDHGETVHVVSGRGRAEIGDRDMALETGDTVYVPAGIRHAWSAPDGKMTLLFTFPADRLDQVTYDFEEA